MRLVILSVIGVMASQSAFAAPPKHKAPAAHKVTIAPHVIPDTGDLGAADIKEIARLGAKAEKDQFSDDPTLSYVGRQVVITIDVNLCTWYHKDTHTLKVALADHCGKFMLGENVQESSYVGQNGFGAKAVITKYRGEYYKFALAPGCDQDSPGPSEYSVVLDGKSAEELMDALRLRITATIVKADGVYAIKNSTLCKRWYGHDATVDEPSDQSIDSYEVSLKPVRYEWLDSRTGAILKTIDLPSDTSK